MVNPIKWKKDKESRDKENNDSVKIISEESGEVVGELRFNFNTQKKRD